jgi:hypothetical protein
MNTIIEPDLFNFEEDIDPSIFEDKNVQMNDVGVDIESNDNIIDLNVGGESLNVSIDFIKATNLDNSIMTIDGEFFLDHDPTYFKQAVNYFVCKDSSQLSNSVGVVYILHKYGLSDIKPDTKIILQKNAVVIDKYETITIECLDTTFVTTNKTIIRSDVLMGMLKDNYIKLDSIKSTLLRHVLNLLRYGELCIYNTEIINLLCDLNIKHKIVLNTESDTKKISQLDQSATMLFDYNLHTKETNIINKYITHSKLDFNTDIIFDLSNHKGNISECILVVDLPIDAVSVINISNINTILNSISFVINNEKDNSNQIICLINQFTSILYSRVLNKQILKIIKTGVIHNDKVIDVLRVQIVLPLYINYDFTDKKYVPYVFAKLNNNIDNIKILNMYLNMTSQIKYVSVPITIPYYNGLTFVLKKSLKNKSHDKIIINCETYNIINKIIICAYQTVYPPTLLLNVIYETNIISSIDIENYKSYSINNTLNIYEHDFGVLCGKNINMELLISGCNDVMVYFDANFKL